MQGGGKKDYSPVSAVIQVALSVLIHICGMHIFKTYRILHSAYKRRHCLRLCPYLHFLVPDAEIVGMNF